MENVKLNFVILCDNAFVAKDSDTLNVIGIFDKIKVNKLPAIIPRFFVVTNVNGDVGTHKQIIILKNKETSEKIAELSGDLIINTLKQKAQFIGKFFNILFSSKGEYVIEVFIDGELQGLTANLIIE